MELSDLALFKAIPTEKDKLFVRILCGIVTGFGYGATIIGTGYLLEIGMQLAR